jgi:DNA end-binding protein Ku
MDLINAKRSGKTIAVKPRPRGENVVDLMEALKKSIASETAVPKGKKLRKASAGQKESFCRSRERSPLRRR